MSDENNDVELEKLTSPTSFNEKYRKVLVELDSLYKGVYDETEAQSAAALCLLAQASLIRALSHADLQAKSLKRDIDFAKADAYSSNKANQDKKLTEKALEALINQDPEVRRLTVEQNKAEKESKEFTNILAMLKDAHITFRTLIKRGT